MQLPANETGDRRLVDAEQLGGSVSAEPAGFHDRGNAHRAFGLGE
jgi:hypothetical protein